MAEALVSTIMEKLDSARNDGRFESVDEEILQQLTTKLHDIQSVLRDAETRQVKEYDVKDWLDKVKDTFFDIEDVLDEWTATISKTGGGNTSKPSRKVSFPIPYHLSCCRQVVLRSEIAVKIENLSRKLDVIASEKDKYRFSLTETEEPKEQIATSAIDLPEVRIWGRDKDKNELLNLLLNESCQLPIFPVISIVGMRGSGKTTLAQQVFHTGEVRNHFDHKIWVQASDIFDAISIAKAVLKYFNVMAPKLVKFETLFDLIKEYIRESKILLVLDDVWLKTPKSWKKMRCFLEYSHESSRILVTIHKQNKMKMLGPASVISLGRLSEEDCWSLFSQVAFPTSNNKECNHELEGIGRTIVSKCNGLPFTIKILGGLLRLKTTVEEWKRVSNSKLWELEYRERGIILSLLLSYYDLPTKLRKCFSYCALFPKNYKLEKSKLINLWMIQGYLKVEGREDMENVGEEYFDNLVVRYFFHDFERRHDNGIKSCRMPDVIHEFAQFLAKNECCTTEVGSPNEFQLQLSYKKVRHLKIMENSIPTLVSKKENLWRLVKHGLKIGVGSKFFEQLTCIRTLDLSDCSIEELPRGIKNLKHLRCLNLSHNKDLKELPEALFELYNLQMLNISNCYCLQNLPCGIGRLINLLHLINHGTPLSYVPKEIEKLTNLQTLTKFVVNDEKDDNRACRLEYLANLKDLKGFLTITGLGNVNDAKEVNGASLGDKEILIGLGLRFDGLTHVDDEEIFKGLKPPPNLEELTVQYYIGRSMSLDPLKSLLKLRVLKLSFCLELEKLPPLGKLPVLESLFISDMKNVKSVGGEFSGEETDGRGTVFPELRTLEFKNMEAWSKWEDIAIMSCLLSLTIAHCKKLEALPDNILKAPKLQKLDIYNCSFLNERYNKKKGQDWSKISHIPNIKIAGGLVQRDANETNDKNNGQVILETTDSEDKTSPLLNEADLKHKIECPPEDVYESCRRNQSLALFIALNNVMEEFFKQCSPES